VSKVSKIAELIRQENHPAIQLVLRALAHIKDKVENGADVDVIYSNDYDRLVVMTKTGRLIIKKVEIDNVSRIRVVYMRINKSCEGTTKVTLKQYILNYNKELLTSLIFEIDNAVEETVIDGVGIDERLDNIVSILKALSH
jgi:hypothetical protein